MELVAYLRVSTASQAEDGLGLDVQEATVRRWAENGEHQLVRTFADEGLSGTTEAATRPALTAALTAIEDGEAGGLAVARLDRLARSLTVQEAILGHIWKIGGAAFSADIGEIARDDPTDPMRTFLRQLLGAVAQLDRGLINARLAAGRKLKAERGGYAFGAPAFGFRAESRSLASDETERAAIARIVHLREQGLSFRKIARELEQDGILAKRGTRWHPESLRRILARPALNDSP